MPNKLHIENSYFKYKKLIYNAIFILTDDHEIAMDITQQTFLNVLDNNIQIGLTQFGLLKIAHQQHRQQAVEKNHIQFDKIDQSIELNYFNDQNSFSTANNVFKLIQSNVENSLNKMKITAKELLILYFIENMSIIEIAAITQRLMLDIKINLYHAQIILESMIINSMKNYHINISKQCQHYLILTNQFYLLDIPSSHYQLVNSHIKSCKFCSNNNACLKQIGVLLNLIPTYRINNKLIRYKPKNNRNKITYIH